MYPLCIKPASVLQEFPRDEPGDSVGKRFANAGSRDGEIRPGCLLGPAQSMGVTTGLPSASTRTVIPVPDCLSWEPSR